MSGYFLFFFLYAYYMEKQLTVTIHLAVLGMLFGECFSMLFSIISYWCTDHCKFPQFTPHSITDKASVFSIKKLRSNTYCKTVYALAAMAIPLSGNRIVTNLLLSLEAVSLPEALTRFGLSQADALRQYGVVTGMVLPLILFPGTITNSVSVMLLPFIAEADARNQIRKIQNIIRLSIIICFIMGVSFGGLLFCFAPFFGSFLFKSTMAIKYIRILSFLCPFLYITSTLTSILHGLGKTGPVFLYSTASLCLRVLFVCFLVQQTGMIGYLGSILGSQILMCYLVIRRLRCFGS
ncbi:MAG: polysaccharide biosynthesis C-terminal domain-containing protein [Lachnospiraceae bacterium]|nr:polysaccharide biosynthesis C-terminal domain-containing protein [Lachnospiraceae bacterium]